MTLSTLCIVGAALCSISAIVTSMLITAAMEKWGVKTPFPLLGLLLFRNVSLYRQETLKAEGRVGPLFYWFVKTINPALILAILALVSRPG